MATHLQIKQLSSEEIYELAKSLLDVVEFDNMPLNDNDLKGLLVHLKNDIQGFDAACNALTEKVYSVEIDQKKRRLDQSLQQFVLYLKELEFSSQENPHIKAVIETISPHIEIGNDGCSTDIVEALLSKLEIGNLPMNLYSIGATSHYVEMKRSLIEFTRLCENNNKTFYNIKSPGIERRVKELIDTLSTLNLLLGQRTQTELGKKLVSIFENEASHSQANFHVSPIKNMI